MTDTIPRLERITDYLGYYAVKTPTHAAASFNGTSISYWGLEEQVKRCAKALIGSGVEKGDRVAVLSPPHPDFLITFLATASIGAIWLGLNPRYKKEEYKFILGDARPKVLFSRVTIGERDYTNDLEDLVDHFDTPKSVVALQSALTSNPLFVNFEAFLQAGSDISDADLATRCSQTTGADAALLVYTSGSTGKPKGALLPHRGLVTCCHVQSRYWNADPVRILNFLPISHVGCVGDISSFVLLTGGCNVFMEQFEPRRSLELIESERITIWGGIPTTIKMCLDLPDVDHFDLSSIQIIAWSGAAAPKSLIDRMRAITPQLSVSYGLTESVGSVTYAPVGSAPEVLSNTIGKPAPEYGFRIATNEGVEAKAGEEGEIQLRGDFLMLEYFNKAEATAFAFDDMGWMRTGDIGRRRPDGNIELVGRAKEMYKSGGYNVYPREIEIVLETHPGVEMAAVIGVPDPLYGEVGHAFILPVSEKSPDTEELAIYCREHLANFKAPKVFTVETTLPLLPIGKIDKPALKARFAEDQVKSR